MKWFRLDGSAASAGAAGGRRRGLRVAALALGLASIVAGLWLWARDADGSARRASTEARASGNTTTEKMFTSAGQGSDPERRLVAAYESLVAGDAPRALQIASDLVREHPEFSLAQALYADLIGARAGAPVRIGAERGAGSDTRLDDLMHEASSRIAAVASRPAAGQVPAEFVALPRHLRHVVAVDVSRSRLYLFENGPTGPRLVRDIYVSVGRSGAGKQIEGDRRTPLGIYWITQAVTAPMRDPRLGVAALKINYPNAWDRNLGRTGSGLYIHGVPSEVLARAPLSPDGCVAMSNSDILDLHRQLNVGATPVVISRRLRWVPVETAREMHRDFLAAREAWMAVRARAGGDELAPWYATPTAALPAAPREPVDPESQSVFAWDHDDLPLMVVTTHRTLANGQSASTERQYWGYQQGRWRILFDAPLSSPADGTGTAVEPERGGGRAALQRPAAVPG